MFWAFLILIFIRPFISSLAFPYANSIFTFLLLGFSSLWIILRRKSLRVPNSIKLPLTFFVIALIASLAFSLDRARSAQELIYYVCALLIFILSASLSSREKNSVIITMLFACSIVSIIALYQRFFGFSHLVTYLRNEEITDPFIIDYVARKRVFSPFITPNALAGYLVMCIPLMIGMWNGKQKFSAYPLVYLLILTFLALLFTQSLGALVSLAIGLAVYFYLQKGFKRQSIFLLFGFLAVIIAVFIARTLLQKEHAQPLFSAMMRLNYWDEAFALVKSKPFFGVGLGNFNLPESRYAHNSYVQLCAEMGFFGLGAFLWLIGACLRRGYVFFKESAKSMLVAGLLVASAVFLVHNTVDFTFFLPEISLLWWAILGLLLSGV